MIKYASVIPVKDQGVDGFTRFITTAFFFLQNIYNFMNVLFHYCKRWVNAIHYYRFVNALRAILYGDPVTVTLGNFNTPPFLCKYHQNY